MAKRLQLRRDSTSNWERVNPVLAQGELGIDITSRNFKIGDGINTWNDLDYAIIAGKLGSITGDTYIEVGEGPNAGTIFVYNNGVETARFTSNLYKTTVPNFINDPTNSTSPFNGALTVAGGVGIGEDLNVNGNIRVNSLQVDSGIVADITGNVTGNLFGDLIGGNVVSDSGEVILQSGTSSNNSVFKGRVEGRVIGNVGTSSFNNITIAAGFIDNTIIGSNTPSTVRGTIITATNSFQGNITGNHIGDIFANNGTSKILENGTNGTDAEFIGKVTGSVVGNVTGDIFANNGTSKVLENGTDGSNAVFYGNVEGNINSTGTSTFSNVDINGGYIDNVNIGITIPNRMIGTTIIATEKFIGDFEGTTTGPSTGDIYSNNGVKILENGATGFDSIYHGNIHMYISDPNNPLNPTSIKILDKGTTGTDALFIGNVQGNITGNTVSTGTITTTGNTSLGGNLTVNGTADFTGNITAPNLTYNGTTLALASTRFTIQATTGDTYIDGDLTVAGTSNLKNTNVDGDLGITGDLNLDNDLTVLGTLDVTGATTLSSTLDVTSDVDLGANLNVTDDLTVLGRTTITDDLTVLTGTSSFQRTDVTELNTSQNINVGGDLAVTGATTLTGTTTAGDIDATTLDTTSDVSIGGDLSVAGDVAFTGDLSIDNLSASTVTTTGNINVGANLNVTGSVSVTDDLSVRDITARDIDASRNVIIGGTLDVTGLSTLASVDINAGTIDSVKIGETTPESIKATSVETNSLTVKNGGELRFNEAAVNGINYIGLKAPNGFLSSYTLTLPGVKGVDGNILSFNASGDKLEFVSSDLFGGGQVSVSADNGDDSFDGINRPVKTIKRALQIASGLVYNPTVSFNLDLCYRDVGLIVDSIGWDLVYDSNWRSIKAGLTYSLASATAVLASQKEFTVNALIYLKNQIVYIQRGDEAVLAGNKAQIVINIVNSSVANTVQQIGTGMIPQVSMPNPDNSTVDQQNAKQRLLDNVQYIREEVNGWILDQISTATTGSIWENFVYDAAKQARCKRDIELIVYSIAYDLIYGGNSQTLEAGLKYWDGIGSTIQLQTNDPFQSEAALEYAKILAGKVILDQDPAVNYSGTPRTPGTASSLQQVGILEDLFDYIIEILIDGPSVAPAIQNPTADYTGTNGAVVLGSARNVLNQARGQLQAKTVAYAAKFEPNEKRIIISVASGEYVEDNPIIIPDNVSVVGAGLRACNIRPANANKDMLRVRNGCYFTEITFRDYLNVNNMPSHTFDYAVAFDDPNDYETDRVGYVNLPTTKPIISISPYVQNCSIISFLGGNGVLVDGAKVQTPNKPRNQIEVENPVEGPAPEQGKSMVANAFTMLSFGGTGWRVINDAYAQIVSCFQIFCLNGSYCQSGGYLSITNSATNFGQFALRSSGYSSNAFEFNKGVVVSTGEVGAQQSITAIGFLELPTQHYILRFRDPKYRRTYNLILDNQEELEQTVIDWITNQVNTANTNNDINSIWYNFTYSIAKCRRDINLIINAVAYDTLTGGNARSVENGISYSLANSANLNLQKANNIAAFQKLKLETVALVVQFQTDTVVASKFDIIIDAIDDPATAPESVDFSNIGDITNSYKFSDPNDEIPFNAALVDEQSDSLYIPNHGLLNGTKVIYIANNNTQINGLNNEQTYYIEFVDNNNVRLWTDDSRTTKADIKAIGEGTHKLVKNIREFFIDNLVSNHTSYQELTLEAGNYTFIPGRLIEATTSTVRNRAYVYNYDPTTFKLTVSVELVAGTLGSVRNEFNGNSVLDGDHGLITAGNFVAGKQYKIVTPGNTVWTSIGSSDNNVDTVFIATGVGTGSGTATQVNINVDGVVNTNKYYTATFKILPTTSGSSLINLVQLPEKQIWLHRPSIVNSSGHTWEYAGSGIDYNALPQNGGKTRVAYEQVSDLPGRVYSSGTNELGDFKVGDFIKAENKTGNVQFTNTVTIANLDALKLAIGNIQINEFSSDIDLGDNEIGGPSNNRLSTQLAVRSFLENRLGNFIDREISTNNLAGAIPQLNSLGKLNPDVIPPIRNFFVYRSNGYRSRLELLDDVPPLNILNGDLSTEKYSTVQLTLSAPITASEGADITQLVSGATGRILGGASNTTSIIVASKKAEFTTNFNTTNNLVINGVSTTTKPNTVGTIITEQTANYILSEQSPSQYLLLNGTNNTYNFTGVTTASGANSKAQGTITEYRVGVLNAVDNVTYTPGTGYVDGTYELVPLTSITGSGTGALADLTVSNGSVTNVDLRFGGSGYDIGNVLSASSANLGGTGANFAVTVTDVQKRLYVDNFGGLKFVANEALPDYIQDANAPSRTITTTDILEVTFSAAASIASGPGISTTLNRIIFASNHGFIDGDAVQYSNNSQVSVGGLENNVIYYVKKISNTIIELYTNYYLDTIIDITSTSSGTHKLKINYVELVDDRIYLTAHGYLVGDAVKIEGNNVPSPLISGRSYFIGSVTTNGFTLHNLRSDALDSVSGLTDGEINLGNIGSGVITITKQNVKVIGTIDTSSRLAINWSNLSANNIDAANIISGIINTSRLAPSTAENFANDKTFLRGDSSWARAVQKIRNGASGALTITGDFNNVLGVNEYYNELDIDVDVADGQVARETAGNYTNLGVAKFYKPQFEVGTGPTIGQVRIKPGTVDAGTLEGQTGLYYLDSTNHSTQPVSKGGTNITVYTIGDMIYANGATSLQKLAIGDQNKVLISNGSEPLWSDNLVINSLTVNGNVDITGAASTLNTYDIEMDDNNIELGSVDPILNRVGIINFSGTGVLTTTVTADTGGMIPGMLLSKVLNSDPGTFGGFGAVAKVTSIDGPNQFSFTTTVGPITVGQVTFNVGGASDDTADGGGFTIKSTVNKTLVWAKSNASFNSSENMNLAQNKEYKINNITVLSEDEILGKPLTSNSGAIMTSGSYWVRTFAFMGV